MADPRGFLNHRTAEADAAPGPSTDQGLSRALSSDARRERPRPGVAVHGLRGAVLSHGLPAGEPDSRLERAGAPQPLGGKAIKALHDTNNFPEFTGKTCPAPCESSCVLALSGSPVTIKNIEIAIVDKGWEMGWIKPVPPRGRDRQAGSRDRQRPGGTRRRAAAPRAGHTVNVYERDDRPGGLMTYGIPDFKMAKLYVERRVDQLEAEGGSVRVP